MSGRRWYTSRSALFALQAIVSVALLSWLAAAYWSDLRDAVSRLSLPVLVASVLVLATSQIWGGIRLWLLAGSDRQRLPLLATIRMTFLGFFVGSFLPSTIGGDLARGVAMVRYRFGGAEAAMLLVVDRILNTLMILIIAAATVPYAFGATGAGRGEFVAAAILSILLIALVLLAPRLARSLDGIADSRTGVAPLLRSLATAIRRVPSRSDILALALLLSLASIGASLGAQWILAVHVGLSVTFIELTAVICLVYLVTLLPISLNGLGVQEASITTLLVALGAQAAGAVTFAFAVRIIMLGLAGIGALSLVGRWKGEEEPSLRLPDSGDDRP